MELKTELTVTKQDLIEIKNYVEDTLSEHLVNELSSFTQAAFILQSLLDKIEEANAFFTEEEPNEL